MKKYLAAILSLVLALAMVFAFVGCDKDSKDDDKEKSSAASVDENSIVGDWEGTISAESDGVKVSYDVEITFEDNGDYTMVVDKESFVDATIDALKDACEAQGVDFDEYLDEMGYASVEEMREEGMKETTEEDLTEEGEYEFDGEKFILDDEETEFKLSGNKFEFSDEEGAKCVLKKVIKSLKADTCVSAFFVFILNFLGKVHVRRL